MTIKDKGGPAFPGPSFSQSGHPNGHSMGMSLRDWFAGQALAGIMSNCDSTGMNGWLGAQDGVADFAFSVADAMLEARNG